MHCTSHKLTQVKYTQVHADLSVRRLTGSVDSLLI